MRYRLLDWKLGISHYDENICPIKPTLVRSPNRIRIHKFWLRSHLSQKQMLTEGGAE